MQTGSAGNWNQWIGRARLSSGLILFFYVLTHNLNHALGMISLDALEAGRNVFLAFWRFPGIEWLFYLAIAIHLLVALYALYRRRSLKMPLGEAAQLALGLATPPLLILHVLGTLAANKIYAVEDSYAYVLLAIWVIDPVLGIKQALAVLVVWIHGCIGLNYWLRLKPWFPRAKPYLFAGAILVPVLALVGFVDGGKAVAAASQQTGWIEEIAARQNFPDAAEVANLHAWEETGLWIYAVLVGLVLVARRARDLALRQRGILVSYEGGRQVRIQPGTSLLEASRIAGVPHASVCGGRGRCSTCRVKILKGEAGQPAPAPGEIKVLARIGAAPGTRLACQLRPNAPIGIVPLLAAQAGPRFARAQADYHAGREMEIAILFADLRGFTQFSEQRLPYDVVFLLNRYFRAMGEAVIAAGGHVDKFIGDGVMALFGISDRPELACAQALDAARRMALAMEEMNNSLKAELKTPLRLGIGIHFGAAIVGDMGFGAHQSLTAIGDPVNTASRLESASKELHCQLVVSEPVARLGKLDPALGERHEIEIRGRAEKLGIVAIKDAAKLGS
jgi:adenylate cyclase